MGGRGCAPSRRIGGTVFVLGVLATIAAARADTNQAGRWLKVGSDERPAIVYAPPSEIETRPEPESPTSSTIAQAGKPVIVMLHGMCDTPENECNAFHPA